MSRTPVLRDMQQQQVSEPEPVHIFRLRFFKDVSMISFLNLWTIKTQSEGVEKVLHNVDSFIILEPVCCEKRPKIVPDQLLVWEIRAL